MQFLQAGLLLFILFAYSAATSCEKVPCDTSRCPIKRFCPQGYTREFCGCCILCALREGENCGGLDNMYGSCGLGLHCNRSHLSHATSRGICRRLPGCIDYAHKGGRYLSIGMTARHDCTICHCRGDRQLHCYRAKTERCRYVRPHDSGMTNTPQHPGPATPEPTLPNPTPPKPITRGNDTSKFNDTEGNDLNEFMSTAQGDSGTQLQDLIQNMWDE